MLAPIFRADSTAQAPTVDEVVAVIQQAEINTARVMPPRAAKRMAFNLRTVRNAVAAGDFMWQMLLDRWLDDIDEINAYAHRARHHVEHEAFLAGTSPEDAEFAAPCDTLEDALAADGWLAGAGAAHREVIRLYGPWQIDRAAAKIPGVAA